MLVNWTLQPPVKDDLNIMINEMDIQNNITSGLTITGARMRHRWQDKPTFVSAVISELMTIRNVQKVLITMIYARYISYADRINVLNQGAKSIRPSGVRGVREHRGNISRRYWQYINV